LPISDEVIRFIERHERIHRRAEPRCPVTTLLKGSSARLADRLVPITTTTAPIAAENIPPIFAQETPSGPGWPTGDVEQDNPGSTKKRMSLPSNPPIQHSPPCGEMPAAGDNSSWQSPEPIPIFPTNDHDQ
jgi:2-oxoglutarate ferredoxin oxidoreductase subunit alpha